MNTLIIYFIILAIVAGVAGGLEMYCWMVVGIRQSNKIRNKYLTAVMSQEVAYFDVSANSGGLITSLNDDTAAIQVRGRRDDATWKRHGGREHGGREGREGRERGIGYLPPVVPYSAPRHATPSLLPFTLLPSSHTTTISYYHGPIDVLDRSNLIYRLI